MNSIRWDLIYELIKQQNDIKRQTAELRKHLGQNNTILEQISELEIARSVVANGKTKGKRLERAAKTKIILERIIVGRQSYSSMYMHNWWPRKGMKKLLKEFRKVLLKWRNESSNWKSVLYSRKPDRKPLIPKHNLMELMNFKNGKKWKKLKKQVIKGC